jgi:hypothetical protein
MRTANRGFWKGRVAVANVSFRKAGRDKALALAVMANMNRSAIVHSGVRTVMVSE